MRSRSLIDRTAHTIGFTRSTAWSIPRRSQHEHRRYSSCPQLPFDTRGLVRTPAAWDNRTTTLDRNESPVSEPDATGAYQPAPLPPPGERFAPGTLLTARYRVVAPLGKGGRGEVYRADDLTLGQPVALKFPPVHIATDPDQLAQFRKEVASARRVSYPDVCRVSCASSSMIVMQIRSAENRWTPTWSSECHVPGHRRSGTRAIRRPMTRFSLSLLFSSKRERNQSNCSCPRHG